MATGVFYRTCLQNGRAEHLSRPVRGRHEGKQNFNNKKNCRQPSHVPLRCTATSQDQSHRHLRIGGNLSNHQVATKEKKERAKHVTDEQLHPVRHQAIYVH